jgi:hypothetical protein
VSTLIVATGIVVAMRNKPQDFAAATAGRGSPRKAQCSRLLTAVQLTSEIDTGRREPTL